MEGARLQRINIDEQASIGVLLQSNWFLFVFGGYLSMQDWRSVTSLNHQIRDAIQEWIVHYWPVDIQEHLQRWPPPGRSLLVFGCHYAYSDINSFNSTRLNPSPIIQFCLDNIAFDAISGNLEGNPWKEIISTNIPPMAVGRMDPGVCLANDSGSKVFHCGGRMKAKSEIGIINNEDFEYGISTMTMIFDLTTLTWSRLPDMPEGRYNASVSRIGSKILVITGEDYDDGLGGPHPSSRSVLCFDLVQGKWLDKADHRIPDFPGNAYCGSAVGKVSSSALIVAGGEYIRTFHDEFGPLVDSCREVYLLSLSSLSWTRMPDLPEYRYSMYSNNLRGVVLSKSTSTGGGFRFAVSNGADFLQLVEHSEAWETLSTLLHPDNVCCSTMVQAGPMTFALGAYGAQLYANNANVWTVFPCRRPPMHSPPGCYSVTVNRLNGESFYVMMNSQVVSVAVNCI